MHDIIQLYIFLGFLEIIHKCLKKSSFFDLTTVKNIDGLT